MTAPKKTRGMRYIEDRIGEDIADALESRYHGRGMTLKEIAAEWGIGLSTVSLWMRDLGVETRIFGVRQDHRPAA